MQAALAAVRAHSAAPLRDEIHGLHANQCAAFLRDLKPATTSVFQHTLRGTRGDGAVSFSPCTPMAPPVTLDVPSPQSPLAAPSSEALAASGVYDAGVVSELTGRRRSNTCPQCGCGQWLLGVTSRLCAACGS